MDFSNLNDQQRIAVERTEGALLILAGAGSGKTNVLTHRIAYIINENKAYPSNILAITFTNKASREMKERIQKKMGTGWESLWVGTFHSICMRILRKDIEKIGYDKNFVVYDSADQKTLINDCLKRLQIDDKKFPAKSVLAEISNAKDDMLTPTLYKRTHEGDYRQEVIGNVYALYQNELIKNNALDFDDIIVQTIHLLSKNQDILSFYQNKFKYIHVDEYQDTNNAQYTLISMLSQGYGNLCVVGDDDQSIYGWRGANIKNILNFEKEFKNCFVVKLEQNYRSSGMILDAANSVIANNSQRKTKKLWTGKDYGEKIELYSGRDERDEAQFISNQIKNLDREGNFKLSDIAILYRTNAQSRVFEDVFMRDQIPYKILGGLKFYDRKEIKDLVAYLRVISNSSDNISLKRIVNVPKRGIGQTTVENAQNLANENNVSLFSILTNADSFPSLKRANQKLHTFSLLIQGLRTKKTSLLLSALIEATLSETGLMEEWEEDTKNDNLSRIENLKEFISVAREFELQNPDLHLEEFLEGVSLVSDTDSLDDASDKVLLMTLHSAKGLEFPVVFMVGMEEGVFPSYRSMNEEFLLEEERRLCYVGITRAMEKLYLLHVVSRTLYGNTSYNRPSRFITEIPSDFFQKSISPSYQRDDTYGHSDTLGESYKTYKTKEALNASPFSIQIVSSIKDNSSAISQSRSASKAYRIGDLVEHKRFGKGSIVGIMPENDDFRLDILFHSVGKRTLMANFANLLVLNHTSQ
jgi:DNA helicase II / ATP-dependent DNA helicase PcrA